MKKCISILMAILLLVATSVSAYAVPTPTTAVPREGGEIGIRYVAINSIRAFIAMSGSTATSTASVSHTGASVNVRVILQRSTNGGVSFSDFATLVNRNSTNRVFSVEGSRSGLDTNHQYRTKVIVTVYDANGRQIDTGTAFS